MMTDYSKMKAFLIALELDTAQADARKALARAKHSGKLADALSALKKRDDLTAEYWRVLGTKE